MAVGTKVKARKGDTRAGTGTVRQVLGTSALVVNKMWFTARLEDRELSQRGLAKMLGMDASAVSLMLNGRRKMTAAEAADVARLLSVPVEEVMRHAGIAVPANLEKSVPIVGTVDDRGQVKFGRPKGPQTTVAPPDVGPAGHAGSNGCQALRVVGLGALDGWLVFYRPSEGVSLEAVGRVCVVRAVDEPGPVLRRVERGYESGWHVLQGVSGRGDPQHVRLESAAPVLWMKQ